MSQFVDEAKIKVQAGNGGPGCLSFRREKFIPFGGPNGGDGGDGGSVYLEGSASINTLLDFRYQRNYKAENGQAGMGANCTGKKGNDCVILVPLGTLIRDADTQELLGDIHTKGQRLLVAQGGFHGLGNTRYKSSVNRAPRQTSPGTPGEGRHLHLELRVLADVGLLGLPNAGKSTLLRALSSATPKVADYPFTTLHPHLGVVGVSSEHSFVMADIPGLIEGASQGAGLGPRFLKHLSRTSILLHVVDIAPLDESDPVVAVHSIAKELALYDPSLYEKPRWLVLNKIDTIALQEREVAIKSIVDALDWKGEVFAISAFTKEGTEGLIHALMRCIEERKHPKA